MSTKPGIEPADVERLADHIIRNCLHEQDENDECGFHRAAATLRELSAAYQRVYTAADAVLLAAMYEGDAVLRKRLHVLEEAVRWPDQRIDAALRTEEAE